MRDKHEASIGPLVQTPPDDASVQLQRFLAKQKYKDAVKQAKLIHKARPTPQNHRQLETAYFLLCTAALLGGDGLVGSRGRPAPAGVRSDRRRDSGTVAPLPGQGGAGEGRVPDSRSGEHRAGPEPPGAACRRSGRPASGTLPVFFARTWPEAEQVRQAIEALRTGDEPAALEFVRDISRASPLADWKLLVRGLAAFYRGDMDDAQANWNRLDPVRIGQDCPAIAEPSARPVG